MILVTGGTGLVGSHLLYHLTKKNNIVRAIYRSEEKLDSVKKVFSFYSDDYLTLFKKIDWIKADITDIPSLENVFSVGITCVYHCAAIVSFNPRRYREMRKVNIEGTANIVNFCIDGKVKKLCHVSSIATLGKNINNLPVSEETEYNETENECGYEITKYGAETEIWRASQEGVAVIITNPGYILGSGFYNEGSGKMFSQVQKGLKFYTEGITGFVGVQDVVKTMILLMESEIKNEQFVIVSESKSFKEVLTMIASAFHKKPPTIKIGTVLMAVFWRLEYLFTKITGKEPLISKSSAKSSQNKTFYTAVKIENKLNYTFEKVEDTIKKIVLNFHA